MNEIRCIIKSNIELTVSQVEAALEDYFLSYEEKTRFGTKEVKVDFEVRYLH